LLSEYARRRPDLFSHANVYYELGVRHAARRHDDHDHGGSTGLPFDVTGLRAFTYSLDAEANPATRAARPICSASGLRVVSRAILSTVRSTNSSTRCSRRRIDRERTDVFVNGAAYSADTKRRLANAGRLARLTRSRPRRNRSAMHPGWRPASPSICCSPIGRRGYQRMLDLVARMDQTLAPDDPWCAATRIRAKSPWQSREAEETLKQIIAARGPSSETNGLLGRVYKDRWEKAAKAGDVYTARSLLKQAIETYLELRSGLREPIPGSTR